MQHEATSAPALLAAELSASIALPVDVLVLVLQPLEGDVASLCAAACVARNWRDAVSSPRLWTRIGPLTAVVAARLTDARLDGLIRRARGDLRHLNLKAVSKSGKVRNPRRTSCTSLAPGVAPGVTDTGLIAALRRTSGLRSFLVDSDPLSGAGIAVALLPSRGQLQQLEVLGARIAPMHVDDASIDIEATFSALRALLAPEAKLLDTKEVCLLERGGRLCARMCTSEFTCGTCRSVFCPRHSGCLDECGNCGDEMCECCRDEEDMQFCEDCAARECAY